MTGEPSGSRSAGDRIAAALSSADPVARREALRELDDRRRARDEVAVAFPGVDVLAPVGQATVDDVDVLVRLLLEYESFEPPLDWVSRVRLATDVVIDHGSTSGTYHLALVFRVGVDPAGAAREALHHLWVRGFTGEAEQTAVIALVEHLLDGTATRDAVVVGLRGWAGYPELAGVVAAILPRLTLDEQSDLLDAD